MLGDFFPLWGKFVSRFVLSVYVLEGILTPFICFSGTCLGFEAINKVQSNDPAILTEFDSENISWPLYFTPIASSSRMFPASNPRAQRVMGYLANNNITLNSHSWGKFLYSCPIQYNCVPRVFIPADLVFFCPFLSSYRCQCFELRCQHEFVFFLRCVIH